MGGRRIRRPSVSGSSSSKASIPQILVKNLGNRPLSEFAVVLAEHTPGDKKFPGRIYGVGMRHDHEVSYDTLKKTVGNDSISYIWVNKGVTATFYEHAGFKGKSFALRGERYEVVPKDWNDKISSIRLKYDGIGQISTKPLVTVTSGVHVQLFKIKEALKKVGIHSEKDADRAALILAEHCPNDKRFPGRVAKFNRGTSEVDVQVLNKTVGNDTISFLVVMKGVIADFYEHAGFQGRSFPVHGPKVIECLGGHTLHDKVSSIRLTYPGGSGGESGVQDKRWRGCKNAPTCNDFLKSWIVDKNWAVKHDFEYRQCSGCPKRGFRAGNMGFKPETGWVKYKSKEDAYNNLKHKGAVYALGTPGESAAPPVPAIDPKCAPTKEELDKMKAAVTAKSSAEFADAYEAFIGRVKQEQACKSFFDILRPVMSLFGDPPNVKFVEETPAVFQRVNKATEELLKASEIVDSNPSCAPTSGELTTMQKAVEGKNPDAFSSAFFAFAQRISGLKTECDFRTVVKPVQDLFDSPEALNMFLMSSASSEEKLKESAEPIRPIIGAFLLAPKSNPLTDLPDLKQVFMESQMNPADGFLPYTPDSYNDDATQFNVMHNGKRYKIQTNSYSPGKHAVTLFIDPKNNPGLTFWAAQVQKSNKAFYYKGFEGKMVTGEGDWVEIEYPEPQTIGTYALHFNMMTVSGGFVELLDVPPTAWVVLGSKDGVKWDALHETNVGKSGWMKNEWSEFSDIRDGSITQTIGSKEAYTHYRLLVTRWGDGLLAGDTSTLRRLDRWVLGTGGAKGASSADSGTGTGEGEGEESETPAPTPPPTPEPKSSSMFDFLGENKMYVIGGAVLVVLFLIYFFMFR